MARLENKKVVLLCSRPGKQKLDWESGSAACSRPARLHAEEANPDESQHDSKKESVAVYINIESR